MKFHPVSEIFPLMQGQEFAELVEDIRTNGLHEPIWIYQNAIIDGRNRYRACEAAGIDCPARQYEGEEADLIRFVLSLNLHRRHLSETQRAMVAEKLRDVISANLHFGDSAQIASELLKVSRRSVLHAHKVHDSGTSELIEAVEQGRISVSAAADVATVPKDEQSEIVARGEKEILQAAKEIRATRANNRRAERTERLIELSNANAPLVSDRRYPIIYADPPWEYDHLISVSREIENQYPTMDIDAICALPVNDTATEDAMLFLWVPPSFLHKGIRVIEAWGFNYLTSMVWDKMVMGMGYYARQQHEHLLLASRGTAIVPDPSSLSSSVVSAKRTEHSAKPAKFYDIIENMYPALPKIELFARNERPGWSTFGNQVAKSAIAVSGLTQHEAAELLKVSVDSRERARRNMATHER